LQATTPSTKKSWPQSTLTNKEVWQNLH
jgi:hypothetical protein